MQIGSLAQMWGLQEVTECPQRCQLHLVGFGHLMPEKEQMSTGVESPNPAPRIPLTEGAVREGARTVGSGLGPCSQGLGTLGGPQNPEQR